MSMLTGKHEDVFIDIRESLAGVFGLDSDFKCRLAKADQIELKVSKNEITICIRDAKRTEGFTDVLRDGTTRPSPTDTP